MSPPASQETLEALAEANGYDVRVLERVARILGLLQAIFADEMLKDMYVLKGGTALNVFHLDLPRLSVDIDLNFVGALDLDETRGMRGGLEDQIARIARSQGFQVPPPPGGHAGGKWRLRFGSVLGGAGQIEVDLNYLPGSRSCRLRTVAHIPRWSRFRPSASPRWAFKSSRQGSWWR